MACKAFPSVLLAAGLLLAPLTPAAAGTEKETPGTPCTAGGGAAVGNPCNGNNGNPSPKGNAGEKVKYDRKPEPFTITRPSHDSGAFIAQIGEANAASILQSTSSQYARIGQTGDDNDAQVEQSGTGDHYAAIQQTGNANQLSLAQSGSAAQVALLSQQGTGNSMSVHQQGGLVSGGVAAIQLGDDNELSLLQSGEGNQAVLRQEGSGNLMLATQTGGNNQLEWTQIGDNLSSIQIDQTGGQALQVTQSR